MPMSPSSFVPSEHLQPGDGAYSQAPQVRPETNYAPQQIENMGQAVSGAGSVAFRTGQQMAFHIAETLDDANVKSAETQLIQSSLDILHGDNGYMNTKGVDAINGYQPAAEALVKVKQDIQKSLGNDVQKAMFAQVGAHHLATFGATMGEHRSQERSEYVSKEYLDAAQNRRVMTQQSPIGSTDYEAARQTGVNEILGYLKEKGIPADSEQGKDTVRKYTSLIVDDDVNRLMRDGKYAEAKQYLKEQMGWSGGTLPPDMIKQGNVDVNNRTQRTNADGSVSTIFSVTVPLDKDGKAVPWEAGGKDNPAITQYALVPGMDTSGKFFTPSGNKPDKVTGAYEDKAAAYYNQTGGQLGIFKTAAAADKFANATHDYGDGSGKPVYLPPSESKVDPDTADRLMKSIDTNFQRVDVYNTADAIFTKNKGQIEATDLEAMRAEAEKIPDVEKRKDVLAQVTSMFGEASRIKQEAYNDNLNYANNWKAAHGSLRGIDQARFGALDAVDQKALRKPEATETDMATIRDFIINPEKVTVPIVDRAYADGKLSKETYTGLLERAMSNAKNPKEILSATADNEGFKLILASNGFNLSEKATDNEKTRVARVLYQTNRDILDWEQKHGKIDDPAKDKFLFYNIAKVATVSPTPWVHRTSPWDTSLTVTPGATTYAETRNFQGQLIVPDDMRAWIIREAKDHKEPAPTEDQIRRRYEQLRAGNP